MTWAKIDDRFPRHPKVLRAGGDAAWLYVAGLCYANEHLTDGRIPALAVPTLTDRKRPLELAEKLVSVRLWERDGEDFLIHDYHDENETADVVRAKREALSAKRRAAGVEGGRRSGESRRKAQLKQVASKLPRTVEAKGNPDADADADVYFSLARDPSTTGSGHGLQAQPRMFSAGDVERLYSEVTSKTAHPQACAPVAQAIAAAAVSKACDPADLTRKVFAAFPAYRAHCKTLGWDVHPSLRGIDAHIDRLLLWLDGEKPVGQPPGRSPPQASGANLPAPDEKLDPMYRPSVPRVRTAPNCATASTPAGDDQPVRAGPMASSLSTGRSP